MFFEVDGFRTRCLVMDPRWTRVQRLEIAAATAESICHHGDLPVDGLPLVLEQLPQLKSATVLCDTLQNDKRETAGSVVKRHSPDAAVHCMGKLHATAGASTDMFVFLQLSPKPQTSISCVLCLSSRGYHQEGKIISVTRHAKLEGWSVPSGFVNTRSIVPREKATRQVSRLSR